MGLDSTGLSGAAEAAGLGSATIYVTALSANGPRLVRDSGQPVYPASMIKVPLAVAAATAIGRGRTSWDATVTVLENCMTFTDAPSPFEPGYAASVHELVELMISRSDNVATNVLMDHLDRAVASADIAAFGLPGTAFRRKLSGKLPLIDDPAATGRNTHPAADAAELFERIARGYAPASDVLFGYLNEQMWNTKLSAGLESGDRFAHKTGDTDDTSHDGGILDLAGGRRFVIVVYTELPSNDDTDARFAAFMRHLRPLLVAS